MATTEYLPFATGAGANVESQGTYAGSGPQTVGVQSGIIASAQMNKTWRQASVVAAMLTQFIADTLGVNITDNGNVAALEAQFITAIGGVAHPGINVVAFSPTPHFDYSQSVTQEITLTGNVTGATDANKEPGDLISYIIHQNSAGGHTFVWPTDVPGAAIDTGANKTSLQSFMVDSSGTLHPYPMTSS